MSTEAIEYAIYKDTGGSYRIQAVPVNENSFDSRKKLPSLWRGVRDENLSNLVRLTFLLVFCSKTN